ncbi:hypothetical protein [Streptomyces shenzhenensis]|uniref:hypothetical protein n=1 Tax=Streptomyces shenzhenensis TaxID=943815 RepID=UPI0011C36786|nr:hypothetical protein [Streptomyces shenzhenensis]
MTLHDSECKPSSFSGSFAEPGMWLMMTIDLSEPSSKYHWVTSQSPRPLLYAVTVRTRVGSDVPAMSTTVIGVTDGEILGPDHRQMANCHANATNVAMRLDTPTDARTMLVHGTLSAATCTAPHPS